MQKYLLGFYKTYIDDQISAEIVFIYLKHSKPCRLGKTAKAEHCSASHVCRKQNSIKIIRYH